MIWRQTSWGCRSYPGDDRSTSYLRMDEYHHRVELRSNGSDDLDFTGWEVPDQSALQRLAQQLEDGGVKVISGTRDEADDRRVIDLFRCVDPSGVRTEIFCGCPIDPKPFHPGRAMTGFKTGEMGLGHMVLYTPSLDESVRFYRDLLGFRVSDFTEVRLPGGQVRLAFLHCNPRHHSIAFIEAEGCRSGSTISRWSATRSSMWASRATSASNAVLRSGSTWDAI